MGGLWVQLLRGRVRSRVAAATCGLSHARACGGRTIGPGLSARCGACGGFNVNGALKGVCWDFKL